MLTVAVPLLFFAGFVLLYMKTRTEIEKKEWEISVLKYREWLAAKLFRLALWVGGIEVTDD